MLHKKNYFQKDYDEKILARVLGCRQVIIFIKIGRYRDCEISIQ